MFFYRKAKVKDRYMIYDMTYLSAAIGLTPGGSTHLHINNTQNDTINNKTTRITKKQHKQQNGRVLAVPSLCEFYPGICLTTEGKAQLIVMPLPETIAVT
jgi:hypothetical protein